MGVHLIVQPRVVVTKEEFMQYPPYSIAIDGYCSGAPFFSSERRVLNINHHEDCDRIATRASCAQAFHRLNLGLYDRFTSHGHPRADLYVGDGDQDVSMTTYALIHHKQIQDPRYRYKFKEMVQVEDLLDMSAGLYPFRRAKRWRLMKRLLWINEPYTDVRTDGSLHTMDAEMMHAMILQVHRRIRDTLYGRGKEVELDDRFDVLDDFGRWQFIREIGKHARIGVAQKGLKAFVSHLAPCSGAEGDRYAIVRITELIDWFPLQLICDLLNKEERMLNPGSTDSWGGNFDVVIGSPRGHGSKMAPSRVLEIVKHACEMQAEFLTGGSRPQA